MRTLKKIGITQRIIEEAHYKETRDALDINWARWFHSLEMLPIPLPSHYDFAAYVQDLDLDGVLLSGGNDLSVVCNHEINRARDAYERMVIETCIRQGIPLIGICRGMQMIGHYFGLSLMRVDNHVNRRHEIIDTIGHTRQVNSFHQYGFTACTDAFTVEAYAPDGCIEAFRHKKYSIYGQMWHPERESVFSAADLALMQRLFGKKEERK